MPQPLLSEGEYVEDTGSAEFDRLHQEVADLKEQLHTAQGEVLQLKRTNAKAIGALRQQLSPLYRALQAVFGEIEASGVADEPVAGNSRVRALWESWKQKLPGHQSSFIDALLTHGEMSAPQLRVAMKCAHQTVYDTAAKLNKLGLLSKNGGKYSLKQL